MLGRSRQRGKLVLSAQSLCPDILGMLNLSQPFGLGADPLAVDLRPHFSLFGFGINYCPALERRHDVRQPRLQP